MDTEELKKMSKELEEKLTNEQKKELIADLEKIVDSVEEITMKAQA